MYLPRQPHDASICTHTYIYVYIHIYIYIYRERERERERGRERDRGREGKREGEGGREGEKESESERERARERERERERDKERERAPRRLPPGTVERFSHLLANKTIKHLVAIITIKHAQKLTVSTSTVQFRHCSVLTSGQHIHNLSVRAGVAHGDNLVDREVWVSRFKPERSVRPALAVYGRRVTLAFPCGRPVNSGCDWGRVEVHGMLRGLSRPPPLFLFRSHSLTFSL